MKKTYKQKCMGWVSLVKNMSWVQLKSEEERIAWKYFEKGKMWRSFFSQLGRINLQIAFTM